MSRNTSDAEISYYLGIAYDGLGQDREARESYQAAARQSGFRAAAGLRLAELSAREGNRQSQAEFYLQLGMHAAPDDLRTAEELAAILKAEARKRKVAATRAGLAGTISSKLFPDGAGGQTATAASRR